jgi:hypothetical protein
VLINTEKFGMDSIHSALIALPDPDPIVRWQ